jgi:hypothetical protein
MLATKWPGDGFGFWTGAMQLSGYGLPRIVLLGTWVNKGKFGSALRSEGDTGQINEVLCKVLAHNTCVLIQAMHALNIHPLFRDVQMGAGRVLR